MTGLRVYDRPTPSWGRMSMASTCARSPRGCARLLTGPGLQYQALLFRDQELTDDDLVAFSRGFGDLDEAPVQESVVGDSSPATRKSTRRRVAVQDGVPIGSLGSGEAVWHTDMLWDLADPPKASALFPMPSKCRRRVATPSFFPMSAAWDQLPGRLQRRAEGLRAKHDGTHNSRRRPSSPQGVTPTYHPRHLARHVSPAGLSSI